MKNKYNEISLMAILLQSVFIGGLWFLIFALLFPANILIPLSISLLATTLIVKILVISEKLDRLIGTEPEE